MAHKSVAKLHLFPHPTKLFSCFLHTFFTFAHEIALSTVLITTLPTQQATHANQEARARVLLNNVYSGERLTYDFLSANDGYALRKSFRASLHEYLATGEVEGCGPLSVVCCLLP